MLKIHVNFRSLCFHPWLLLTFYLFYTVTNFSLILLYLLHPLFDSILHCIVIFSKFVFSIIVFIFKERFSHGCNNCFCISIPKGTKIPNHLVWCFYSFIRYRNAKLHFEAWLNICFIISETWFWLSSKHSEKYLKSDVWKSIDKVCHFFILSIF